MFRLTAIILIGISYSLLITADDNEDDNAVTIDADDSLVMDAIVFVFGQNSSEKDVEFKSGTKYSTNNTIFKLEVRINVYTQCLDNETSIWIEKTDKGCKSTSLCQTEVVFENKTSEPFRTQSIQCVA